MKPKGQSKGVSEWFVRLMILTLGWVLGVLTCFRNSSMNNSAGAIAGGPRTTTSTACSSTALCQPSSTMVTAVPIVGSEAASRPSSRISTEDTATRDAATTTTTTATTTTTTTTTTTIQPLEHSSPHFKANYRRKTTTVSILTDTANPFHRYLSVLGSMDTSKHSEIPLWNSWIHYLEPYHNHMARFRNRQGVVFMEIGVQSGGKIPLLRKYFGPGFQYVGIDINPSTLQFRTQPEDDFSASIEIGDSANATFLEYIKEKYPHVDIFLDDGGHTMEQQITAIQHFLPHVQPEGVYMCEDLGTSWQKIYGGIPNGKTNSPNRKFINETMVGFVHQTMDWFTASTMRGRHSYYAQDIDTISNCKFDCKDSTDNPWWKTIPKQVKHIHYYNQLVVFEKGVTQRPTPLQTVGTEIPVGYSGEYDPINWKRILTKIDEAFEAANVEFI